MCLASTPTGRLRHAMGLIVLGLLLSADLCIPHNIDFRNSVDWASGDSERLTTLLHLAIGLSNNRKLVVATDIVSPGENELGMQRKVQFHLFSMACAVCWGSRAHRESPDLYRKTHAPKLFLNVGHSSCLQSGE
jgi:hypothetical protein